MIHHDWIDKWFGHGLLQFHDHPEGLVRCRQWQASSHERFIGNNGSNEGGPVGIAILQFALYPIGSSDCCDPVETEFLAFNKKLMRHLNCART